MSNMILRMISARTVSRPLATAKPALSQCSAVPAGADDGPVTNIAGCRPTSDVGCGGILLLRATGDTVIHTHSSG